MCVETRHTKAFLKAQVNKTDRNDALIPQMMRVNLFRPVHVKTLTSQKRRALLTARKMLQGKAIALESDIRGLLRNFGLKVGVVGTVGFDRRIHELVEGMPDLAEIMQPLLDARKVLREHFVSLHRKLLLIARDDDICRRHDGARGRTCGSGLCRHRRHSGSVPELQSCGSCPRLDTGPASIRREQTGRPDLPMW